MKNEEAARISVDHCVRDSEIEEIQGLLNAADPGEWRPTEDGLRRYSGTFERRAESLLFAARARSFVPRLLKGIRVLEEALASARIEVALWRREAIEHRERAEQDARRRSEGQTGPEDELQYLARLAELSGQLEPSGRMHNAGSFGRRLEGLLREWTGGRSIRSELVSEIESIEHRLVEKRKAREERDAETKTARDRLLSFVARLEAGDVPAEVAEQWARLTKEARKKILAERRDPKP